MVVETIANFICLYLAFLLHIRFYPIIKGLDAGFKRGDGAPDKMFFSFGLRPEFALDTSGSVKFIPPVKLDAGGFFNGANQLVYGNGFRAADSDGFRNITRG